MTLTDSNRQQLLEILSGEDYGDLIRESVRMVLQELIEAESVQG